MAIAARMAERWYIAHLQAVQARAARPAAAHPVRGASAFPADQHALGRNRRGHRRRDREREAPRHPAVRRRPGRNRSRARPRAGARVSVRHGRADGSAGPADRPGPAGAAAVVHRRHGGVPVDWSDRHQHRDVGPRSVVTQRDADDRQARRPRFLSRIATATPSGPTSPAAGATAPSATCCAPPAPRATSKTASAAVLGTDTGHLSKEWHESTRRSRSRRCTRRARPPSAFGRPLISARERRRRSSTCRRRSALTASRLVFLSRTIAVLDRHVSSPTSRRGRSARRMVETDERSAFRQPAVPELGRRLGARQSPLRVCRAERGAAGADDRRCRIAAAREASTSSPTSARSTTRPGRPTAGSIAFSAMKGGVLDLYLFDLESGRCSSSPTTRLRISIPSGRRMAASWRG